MELDELDNSDGRDEEEPCGVDRVDVVLRTLYSLIFLLVISLLESLLLVVVAFQLLFSLVSEKLPGPSVQAFANRTVAYFYQILRYVTHNDSVIPFPFSDFPAPPEPSRPAYAPRRTRATVSEESA